MHQNKRKLWYALLLLIVITALTSGMLLWKWNSFTSVSYQDYTNEVEAESYEEGAKKWIASYLKQYEGIFVPYSHRIHDVEIASVEALSQIGFYEVNFQFQVSYAYADVLAELRAGINEAGSYSAQRVIQLSEQQNMYSVIDSMTPVQYQLAHEPIDEPAPPTYTIGDKQMAYVIEQEQLRVTYNYGKTYASVPVSYADITRGNVAYDRNRLQEGSYLVDEAYTAFLYTGEDRSLNIIYSLDKGNSWKRSTIAAQLYQRVKFLSKTEQYVYVLTTTDKAMSAEAHALYRSSDFETFTMVEYQDPQARIMTYATFLSDSIGYVAYTQRHMEDGAEDFAILYRTVDGGKSFEELHLPVHEVTIMEYTYAPFVQVERIYEEKGRIHVIVNQGENGDYGSHGILYQAHYVSEDGIHFTFLEEFLPESNLAG